MSHRPHPAGWGLLSDPLKEWTHAGVDCAIALGFASLNGYVRLPRRHPWRLRDYDEIPADVHGGLTADMRHGYRVTWSVARLRAVVEDLAAQVAAVPLERPVERARRQRLTSALRTRERRARRHGRGPATHRPDVEFARLVARLQEASDA